MMFAFIVKAEALGAVPNTSTVKSIPLDNNLLVAVFLAVFFTAMFLNLILPPCTSPFTLYEEAGSANTPICFALDLKFLVYTTYCVEFAMVFSFLVDGKSVLNIPVSILFPFPWFVNLRFAGVSISVILRISHYYILRRVESQPVRKPSEYSNKQITSSCLVPTHPELRAVAFDG